LEIRLISEKAVRLDKAARVKAYLYAVTEANIYVIREAMKMGKDRLTLEQVLEEVGLIAKWQEAEALTIAQNLVNLGVPFETVISATNLDPEKVRPLYQSEAGV
jgi:predicted transposase YdaD